MTMLRKLIFQTILSLAFSFTLVAVAVASAPAS
jgi:hypothetical protein